MGSDEDRDRRERPGRGRSARRSGGEGAQRAARNPRSSRREIPQTRIGRSARLGTALGTQATRYAGTAAANVVRSDEKAQERLETRHLETALKMASVLGEMKGAAMKIGQMASFIDVDFLPPEYREIYQEQLAKLRDQRSRDALGEGPRGARGGVRRSPGARLRRDRGGGLRRRLDRAGPPGDPPRRHQGRGQDPVPGDRRRPRVGRGERRASSCAWRRC